MFFKRSKASKGATLASKIKRANAPSAKARTARTESEENDTAKTGTNKDLLGAQKKAAAFGRIVTVLMCSPADRRHTLGDLEWLVVPAISHGQFLVAEMRNKTTRAMEPVGFVLWALVSPAVDRRLSNVEAQPRLLPTEWKSGDIPWVIAGTGDPVVLRGLLRQLTKSVFKDVPVKMRVRGADGNITAGILQMPGKALTAPA